MNAKDTLLLDSLRTFYSDPKNASEAKRLIGTKSKISLRVIDWLVTTHAKRHRIFCMLDNGSVFDVHSSYKAQLRSFSKQRFDIFRRGERLKFMLGEEEVETTLAQLAFIRWLIRFNVIRYYTEHAKEIENALHVQQGKQEKEEKRMSKRSCHTACIRARVIFD
jgi:hypothetical protein